MPAPRAICSRTAPPRSWPTPCGACIAASASIDPELAAEAWSSEPDPLTERERQILWRAGEGRSSADIAAELHLSEGTVRNYLSEAINKLGAANRVEAARLARAKGWLVGAGKLHVELKSCRPTRH